MRLLHKPYAVLNFKTKTGVGSDVVEKYLFICLQHKI